MLEKRFAICLELARTIYDSLSLHLPLVERGEEVRRHSVLPV